MKYSIIIPTYNHCDDLLKPCVESILTYSRMDEVELIISANGCTDNTQAYLAELTERFASIGMSKHFRYIWNNQPLGYAKANNLAIARASTQKIVLLNNDTVLLPQERHTWLDWLHQPFESNDHAGISCVVKTHDPDADYDFAIFFCVMIDSRVFDRIGLLNTEYEVGGCEDVEFCVEAQRAGFTVDLCINDMHTAKPGMWSGQFPIYHRGQATLHDTELVPNYGQTLERNKASLTQKYKQQRDGSEMKYSIIIPTYNHCDDLLKPCLESIFAYSRMDQVELIVSANGCVDRTREYLNSLQQQFDAIGFGNHLRVVWHDQPLGYSKAINQGILASTCDKVLLLNNDVVLLPQDRGNWLDRLNEPFDTNPRVGITSTLNLYSPQTGRDFAVFFCVMIHRKVIDKLGLLNEEYGTGAGEDTEYCFMAEQAGFEVECVTNTYYSHEIGMNASDYPIYHKGEGTMHDPTLVPNWDQLFDANTQLLIKKFSPKRLAENTQQVADLYPFLGSQDPESQMIANSVLVKNDYALNTEVFHNKEVIDIGANTGIFSIAAAALGASKVIAFEPVLTTFNKLESNIQHTQLGSQIQCHRAAVLGKKLQGLLMSNNAVQHGGNSLYAQTSECELVDCVTLEWAMQQTFSQNVVLKIDCEGAEYDILLDSDDSVFKRVRAIILEIHSDRHPDHKGPEPIHKRLTDLGFVNVRRVNLGTTYYDARGHVVGFDPGQWFKETWIK